MGAPALRYGPLAKKGGLSRVKLAGTAGIPVDNPGESCRDSGIFVRKKPVHPFFVIIARYFLSREKAEDGGTT
jgi:hypothetical protein